MLIRKLGLLFAILYILVEVTACVKGERSLGSQLYGSDISINSVDSFTVNLSSYMQDSVVTSGKSLSLIGSYSNPTFGKVTASSYVIFGRPSMNQIEDNTVFDSLVMTLSYTGYYYGDTLKPYTLSMHRVNQDIVFPSDASYLFNTSAFGYDSESIGNITFLARPKSKDTVNVKMSSVLGNELFDKFSKYSDQVATPSDFVNYFKGIAFVPGADDSSIVGFDVNNNTMYMTLYYHIVGDVVNVSKSIVMYPYFTQMQFNHISSDRTGTLIENLGNDPISSTMTGNYAYIQGGTGIVTRIDFPSLADILQVYKHMQVLRAEFIIQPVGDVGGDTQFFPQKVNLYYTNKHNDLLSIVKDSQGNVENGNLYEDQIVPSNSTYSWDVTGYVTTVLGNNNINELDGLLIVPESIATTFDRVTFADQFRSHYKTELKLYIASYE